MKIGRYTFFLSLMATLAILMLPSIVYAAPPDTTPPVIGNPVFLPSKPTSTDKVTVWMNVTDNRSGVKNVTIVYTTDNWKTINSTIIASYNATTTVAIAQIPNLPNGGSVAFYVVAYDNNGNRQVNNNSGSYYSYNVPAPSSLPGLTSTTNTWLVYAVVAGVAGTVAIASIKILRKGPKQTNIHQHNH